MAKIISVFAALLLLTCSAACGQQTDMTPKEITLYLEQQLDLNELTEVPGEKISSYFGFSIDEIKSGSLLTASSGSSSDMLAAFEYKDSSNREKIIDNVVNYLSATASTFKNTMDAEYRKIQSRLLYEYGDIIILVVCGNWDNAAEVLAEMGAVEIK